MSKTLLDTLNSGQSEPDPRYQVVGTCRRTHTLVYAGHGKPENGPNFAWEDWYIDQSSGKFWTWFNEADGWLEAKGRPNLSGRSAEQP
jgi:hypothetical protein